MNNQPSPDLFPDLPRRPRQRRNRLNRRQRFGVGMIVIAGIFFILGGVYSYFDPQNVLNRKTEIPLISPEAGPIKERPAVPGGVDVPHREVTIFDHLGQKDAATAQIEHLLPPAEAPSEKAVEVGGHEEATNLLVATPPIVGNALPVPAQPVDQLAVKPLEPQTTLAPSEPMPPPETIKPTVEIPAKAPEKEAPPLKDIAIKLGKPVEKMAVKPDPKSQLKVESTPVMPAGLQRVQLAAFPNAAQAEDKMFQIVSGHAELLRQVKLSVAKADLGARGTFYRIQSQPMQVPAAHKLCADLKAAGVGCILVK